MSLIVGIDPGQSGGLAFTDSLTVHNVMAMPELTELINMLSHKHRQYTVAHIFLEKAQAMPKQGVSSMFSYGRHFGELIGVIMTLRIPFTLVQPREWTKQMHEGTDGYMSPKERSLQAALRLFPGVNLLATERSKKPHEGIIDALLIAEYGRRKIIGSPHSKKS